MNCNSQSQIDWKTRFISLIHLRYLRSQLFEIKPGPALQIIASSYIAITAIISHASIYTLVDNHLSFVTQTDFVDEFK